MRCKCGYGSNYSISTTNSNKVRLSLVYGEKMIENKWKGKLNRYPKPPLTHTHTVFLVAQLIRWDAQCSLSGLNITPHNVLMKVWSYNGFYTQFTCWKKNYHYYCYYIIIIAINICINSRQFFFIGSFENFMHDFKAYCCVCINSINYQVK